MNDLWKPDEETKKALKRGYSAESGKPKGKAKKSNPKKKRKAKRDRCSSSRKFALRYFGLYEKATNMAICMRMKEDFDFEFPANKEEATVIINEFYKLYKNKEIPKRCPKTPSEDFYKSKAWLELRYIALSNSDGRCCICGASAKDGVQLHVDHIIPRSRRPDLELDLDNVQITCDSCNWGKNNYDTKDFRF